MRENILLKQTVKCIVIVEMRGNKLCKTVTFITYKYADVIPTLAAPIVVTVQFA